MGRPKASEAKDTRQELLDAALELFAQNGFHGTGLRDIARAVGIRESAVYHHFPSKESLLEALLTQAPSEAPAHVGAFLQAPLPEDLAPFFESLLVGLLERCATLRERKRFRVMMNDGLRLALEGRVRFMDKVGGAAREQMLQLMRRLVENGRLVGDPELLGVSFMAPVMMWRQLQELNPSHRFFADYRAFAKGHVRQFLAGGLPRPAVEAKKNDRSEEADDSDRSAAPRPARRTARRDP